MTKKSTLEEFKARLPERMTVQEMFTIS